MKKKIDFREAKDIGYNYSSTIYTACNLRIYSMACLRAD